MRKIEQEISNNEHNSHEKNNPFSKYFFAAGINQYYRRGYFE